MSDLFQDICAQINERGFFIKRQAFPPALLSALYDDLVSGAVTLKPAGIGRGAGHLIETEVRTDAIAWIDRSLPAGRRWYQWADQLRQMLNYRFFLGLRDFESHYACYQPDSYYRKHIDAFRGKSNRKLSLLVYLNHDWRPEDGGELVLYEEGSNAEITRVLPEFATLVMFLSEDFPHEVLPAAKERLSIAGWFRVDDRDSCLR